MNLSPEQLFKITQYSFIRLDGAWFPALARKLGEETAWEMDMKVWKQFLYLFGKKIRKDIIINPEWPESFLEALGILSKILKIEGHKVLVESNTITVQVTDCENQKAIAKAGIADCGIGTVHSYQGLMRGLFGKEIDAIIQHTKNLNQGDDCCEVVIYKQTH
jgi:hypothetical protein